MAIRIPRGRGNKPKTAQAKKPPHVLDMEGSFMLMLAALYDLVNIILGILDLLVIGLILSPIWNAFAVGTLGIWLYVRTGKGGPGGKKNTRISRFVLKRVAVPFIGNSVPIAKFFPWWLWSVWTSLDKSFDSRQEPAQQEEQEQRRQTRVPQRAGAAA